MKPIRKLALCVSIGATLLTSSAAFSESLADKERWANQMDYSSRHIEAVKDQCGVEIKLTFEKASWDKVQDQWKDGTPNGRCKDVYDAVQSICINTAGGKEAVKAKVKEVVCGYGGKKSGYNLGMTNGVINYSVEVDKPNVVELIAAELKKKL